MKTFSLALILVSTSAFAMRPIPKNELINRLLEGKREITSLRDMERLNLNSGATDLDLWSGSYWPHYQGSLAIRYRDPDFAKLMKAKDQFDKFQALREKKPLYTYTGMENTLSPAEKYDLLVGDGNMTLTKYSLNLGVEAQSHGKVPTWRGLCDGWSAAAQSMPRPTKSVTLKNAQGLELTFYPEDIKAIGSLFYSRVQEGVVFLGERCHSGFGQITGSCDGTNPGALHKALVNRVGFLKKTFNADVSASTEVWNYPVKSYKISYYNVLTDASGKDFKSSLELFEKKHRFEKPLRRHDRTYAIVGVQAEVTYANMREAHRLDTDSKNEDKDLVKTYFYDLELDSSYNILGGEWVSATRPDFIWAPTDVAYPLSTGEENGKPTTASEIRAAAQVSSKLGEPLSVIVEQLFELSK